MSNNLPTTTTFGELERMAVAMSKSGLFGAKTPEQTLSLLLIGQQEGSGVRALMDYHVISGRPAMRADAMLARFQAAGGKVVWHEMSNDKVSGTFSHPQGGSITIDWDQARVKAAGLGNNPMYSKFGRAMMRSRCVSEAIRSIFPGVISGAYSVEEVQDMAAEEPVVVERQVQVVEAAPAQIAQANSTAASLTAAVQGKTFAATKSQPAPAATATVVEAADPALVAQINKDLKTLSYKAKSSADKILARLTKDHVKKTAELAAATPAMLNRIAELIKAELAPAPEVVVEPDPFEGGNPFEAKVVPAAEEPAAEEVDSFDPFV